MENWRRSFYALCAAQWISIVGFNGVVPFLPLFLTELGISGEQETQLWAGIVLSVTGIAMAVVSPVWGVLADRYGRKLMVQRAMFGGAVLLALMGVSRSVYDLMALRAMQGVVAGTTSASAALATLVSPTKLLSRNLGLIQTSIFAGVSLGPLLGGILADRLGYRPVFVINATMLLAGGLIVTRFVREPKATNPAKPRTELRVRDFGRDLWLAVNSPVLLAMNVVVFAITMASTSLSPVIPIFVRQLGSDGADVAFRSGLVFGSGALASALAAVVSGRYGDRWGHRRIVVWSMISAAAFVLPLAFATTVVQLALLYAMQGAFLGAVVPIVNAIIGHRTPPDRRGAAFGVIATSQCLAFALGPLAGATIAATLGIPEVCAFIGLLLLIVSLTMGRRTPSLYVR